jgi:hypothetical protein
MKAFAHLTVSPVLDSTKIKAKKIGQSQVQLMCTDFHYTTVMADTGQLLEFLEQMTEKVRLLHLEQNPVRL